MSELNNDYNTDHIPSHLHLMLHNGVLSTDEKSAEEFDKVETPKAPVKKSRFPLPFRKKPRMMASNGTLYFVCDVTARRLEKRIHLHDPRFSGFSFINLPTAAYWVRKNWKHSEHDLKVFLALMADQYNQLDIPVCLDQSLLAEFGGPYTYDEWIGDLKYFDIFTDMEGQTVEQYAQQDKKITGKKRKSPSKTKPKFVFEAGTYLVKYNGKTSRYIQKLDADGITRAVRAIRGFAKKYHSKGQPEGFTTPQSIGFFVGSEEGIPANYRNDLALLITGERVVGHVLMFVTKKFSLDL